MDQGLFVKSMIVLGLLVIVMLLKRWARRRS
jgi:hypothetical protein